MAQADEMGEGEGRDDGFVDGGEAVRKRNRKKPGELGFSQRGKSRCLFTTYYIYNIIVCVLKKSSMEDET